MKRFKLTYLLLGCLLLPSCSDFLEQEPGSQTSNNELFSSNKGYYFALNGCYYQFEEILGGERNMSYADLLGGNITFAPNGENVSSPYTISPPNLLVNVYSFDDDSEKSNMEKLYDNVYKLINSTNNILEYIAQYKGLDQKEKNQIISETLCIRGYSHFTLLRYYAQNYSYTADASHLGIVVNTRTLKVGKDYPARKTVAESFEQVISDFEDALALFSNSTAFEGKQYNYFTATSCKALLSRIHLYANNWQKAIDYANEVIQTSGIELTSNLNYVNEWKEPNLPISETLLELLAPFGDKGDFSVENGATQWFRYNKFLVGNDTIEEYGKNVASPDLLNLYEPNDIRGAQSMFKKANLLTANAIDTVHKTYHFTEKLQDNAGVSVMRLSEVYLIKAEAYARLNKPAEALSNLNVIRQRAGLLPLESNENLLDEIFNERRRELCFEGHLFFDIARFHKNVTRTEDCIATTCNLNYPSPYFVLPIPKQNLDLNSNMIPNEGY